MILRLLSLALVGVLLGCSNSKSNPGSGEGDLRLLDQNNGAQLTTQQKIVFTDLVTSLSRLDLAGRAVETGRVLDDARAEAMKNSLRNNQCSVTIVNPGKPPRGEVNLSYKFNINGTNCPISQFAETTIIHQPTVRIYGSLNVRYSVVDATYSGYNDVTTLEFSDFLEGRFSFPRGSEVVNGSGRGNGFIQSHTNGRVEIASTSAINFENKTSGAVGGIEQLIKLTFSNFEVYLRSKLFVEKEKMRGRYFLNGTEISTEDFERYTKYLSLTDGARYGFLQE